MSKKIFIFNKLGRDAIPDLLKKSGIVVHTKELIAEQLTQALRDKLIEEAHECAAAQSIENLKEELADVMEVITAVLEYHNITYAEIENIRLAKHKLKGGSAPALTFLILRLKKIIRILNAFKNRIQATLKVNFGTN
jgi:predicted house-cleaning noncanonical NTP pyrophosphatase (MazG superfamily)